MANYPCTPMRANVKREFDLEKGSVPRIGIDIGGVLTRDGDPMFSRNAEWNLAWEAPGAFEVVWQLVQVFGPSNVFLVSKVKPGGPMQMQIEHWLHETCKFCEITGVRRENIFFVRSMNGPDGKGVVASNLGLTHFVDDKVTCLNAVFSDECGNSGGLVSLFDGVLFHFAKGGYGHREPQVRDGDMPPEMRAHYCGVANWANLRDQLRMRLPGILWQKGNELLVPENVLKIDPNLERKAKPLFASASRAAEERPPWYQGAVSPTAARAASSAPTALSWRNQTATAASSPTASRARSSHPAAVQKTDGARPRLMLKTRDPTLGAVNARPAATVSSAVLAFSPSPRNAQMMVSSPKAASPPGQAAQPVFSLAACLPLPQAAIFSTAPTSVSTTTASTARRPSLSLASPTASMARRPSLPLAVMSMQATPAPAGPALRQDPTGGRPKLMLKPRTAEQPQSVAPAGPALQADPSGGRPKLKLKPRTAEPPKSAGSFMADLQNKLQAR